MYYYKYKTKIGDLYIEADDNYLLSVGYRREYDTKLYESELIKQAYKQLDEYFKGERDSFDLPLKVVGTDFQKAVYREMAKVPYGKVITYKDLAIAANSPKAFRAVGSACNKNKFSIILPCHRIVGSNKDLVGYGGGLLVKTYLLEHEGLTVVDNKLK